MRKLGAGERLLKAYLFTRNSFAFPHHFLILQQQKQRYLRWSYEVIRFSKIVNEKIRSTTVKFWAVDEMANAQPEIRMNS